MLSTYKPQPVKEVSCTANLPHLQSHKQKTHHRIHVTMMKLGKYKLQNVYKNHKSAEWKYLRYFIDEQGIKRENRQRKST